MRITFFIIIFLFISCTNNINKIDNEELKLDEKIRKINYQIIETENKLSIQIGKELERNKKMRADLNSARAKYIVQKELLRELTKVKKPIIFSSRCNYSN